MGVGANVPPSINRTKVWREHLQAQINQLVVAVDVLLPSGVSVLAVRPHLLLMYKNNVFPNALTPLIERLIKSATADDATEEIIGQKIETEAAEAYAQFMSLLDHAWVSAVVDPVFVLDINNPGPLAIERVRKLGVADEEIQNFLIPIDAVSLEDKLYFFNWCQGSSDDVETFRERQTSLMEALEKKQGLDNNAG